MALIDMSETYQMTNVGDHIDGTDVYQSNRNLLDNPFFSVNQRSVSGTITSGYIADRWTLAYGSGGVQASRTEDTITVKSTSGSSHGDIAQRMEKSLFDFLVGKTVTASVMRSDGSVISKSFTFQSAANSIAVGTDLDGNAIAVRVYQASTYQDVQFWKWKTAGTFRAVKLELGSVSTLANDAPPDYGTELAKCQRYFWRLKGGYKVFGMGDGISATAVRIFIPTPVPMLASSTKTVTMNGGIVIRGSGMTGTQPSAVAFNNVSDNGVVVTFTVTGATQYSVYLGVFAGNGYLDFSTEL